jgi:hypothetical protein
LVTGVGDGIAGFSLSLWLSVRTLSSSFFTVFLPVRRGGRVRRGRLAGRAGRAAPPVDDCGLIDGEAAVIGGGQAERDTGISASTSAHISSLISRDGGRDAHDDMRRTLRRRVRTGQSPRTYF